MFWNFAYMQITIKRRANISWFCLIHSSYCFRSTFNAWLTRSVKPDYRAPLIDNFKKVPFLLEFFFNRILQCEINFFWYRKCIERLTQWLNFRNLAYFLFYDFSRKIATQKVRFKIFIFFFKVIIEKNENFK